MNIIEQMKDSIYFTCKREVIDSRNKFTEEQKTEMLNILEDFKATNPLNPIGLFKYKRVIKKFEDAYKKYGGDSEKLEKAIIKDSNIVQIAKKMPGVGKRIHD
jgi:hypothetical protein